jgi:hypothetical protein
MEKSQRDLIHGFASIGANAASIARVLDIEVEEVRKVLNARRAGRGMIDADGLSTTKEFHTVIDGKSVKVTVSRHE